MRICFISQALPYLPSRDGFRLYGANLIRQLSKRHVVELISLLEPGDAEHLDWARAHCSDVQGIPKEKGSILGRFANVASAYLWGRPLAGREEIEAAVRARIQDRPWDLLHVEGPYAAGLIPPGLRISKVLSLHDSPTLRTEEMLKCRAGVREKFYYRFLRHYEPRYERLVYPRFDACTVVAEPDLREVRRMVPGASVALISNGIDTEYYHRVAAAKDPASCVFHGNLSYPPNVDAAVEFAERVLPLIQSDMPGASFHIVGAKPGRKIQSLALLPGIRISADLADLRAAVCSSQVYVCAIRRGTGLKNKILEAMAMEMPIVCYPDSTAGIEVAPGRHLRVAQDPREFAATVLQLFRNPGLAGEMALAARHFVEREYGWESRARSYELLYEEIIRSRFDDGNLQTKMGKHLFGERQVKGNLIFTAQRHRSGEQVNR